MVRVDHHSKSDYSLLFESALKRDKEEGEPGLLAVPSAQQCPANTKQGGRGGLSLARALSLRLTHTRTQTHTHMGSIFSREFDGNAAGGRRTREDAADEVWMFGLMGTAVPR